MSLLTPARPPSVCPRPSASTTGPAGPSRTAPAETGRLPHPRSRARPTRVAPSGPVQLAPMALPVLGGLLISDEVVDLFLPVRFYWVRRARWLKLKAEGKLKAVGPA